MKHQLSKVATIATLAFIGIGFAGTHQAKASDCTPQCNDENWNGDCPVQETTVEDAGPRSKRICQTLVYANAPTPGYPASGTKEVCVDCDGDCVKHKILRSWQNNSSQTYCATKTWPGSDPLPDDGVILTQYTPPPNAPSIPLPTYSDESVVGPTFCQDKWTVNSSEECED